MQLSQRLSSVASMVTAGNCLADVGTDHGYVPIYLYERNIIPHAIAMDVNKGPLERATLHIAESGMKEAIETRLSDGLAALKPGEADSVVIAGMGGPLIIRILSTYPEVTDSLKELILQPQSEIPEVRMWLYEHGYEIIEACEAQSHFDLLAYGGYGHFAYFNTTIKIDKIYRVDVAYKITNDDKPWYQFFLPDEEHQIQKSLTPERVKGGIFGLYNFAGFEEGSYQSTVDGRTNYKYKLHLNYDDTAWNWFVGQEFYECDYRRVSQFQILRMNFLVDGETYDVPIKMDTIEGDTLFILDPDLILDTETPYYDFKNWLDDGIANLKEKFKDYLPYIYAIAGVLGAVLLIWVGIKVYKFFRFLFGWIPDKKDDNQNKKE